MIAPPGPAHDGVTRPRLVAVTGWREGAPVAHLSFRGRPTRWVEMPLCRPATDLRTAQRFAAEQLATASRSEVQSLFQRSHDGPEENAVYIPVLQGILRPGADEVAERELAARYVAAVERDGPRAGVALLIAAQRIDMDLNRWATGP